MPKRSLIQFGKNSFVLSVPKEWVMRNKLKKGSELDIEEISGSLIINPDSKNNSQAVKIKKIVCEGDFDLGRNIISSYVNNYSIIEISGPELTRYLDSIERVTHRLVALEIMEQSSKKLIIKDFLNIQDISMDTIIKRIDVIIRAMFLEAQSYFENGEKISLEKMDEDINRLFFVGYKLLNKVLESPNLSKTVGVEIKDALFYWIVLDSLEKIGDQQKRFVRSIENMSKESPTTKPLREVYDIMIKEYLDVIKALYKFDLNEANKIASNNKEILKKIDEIVEKYTIKCKNAKDVHNTTEAVEKLKRFETFIYQISKAIINKA